MRIKIVGQYIYLIRPFCVRYRWVFLRVVSYLDEPVGRVKIQTTRKNTPRYYTSKGLIIIDKFIIIQLAFFSAKSFGSFLIRREKQSRWRSVARAADWLNRYFLHYKITNCPNNRTISQDICTLFTRYLYSTLCSWIVKQQTEWFTLCVASLIEVWNQEIFGNCSEKLVITLTAKRSDRPRIFELSTRSAFKDLYKIIFLEIIQIIKIFERL